MRARSAVPGFTLIELIVVMAIVALLVTVATPRYFAYLDRSKEAVLRADLAVLRDALDKYHGDHGRYPPTLRPSIRNTILQKSFSGNDKRKTHNSICRYNPRKSTKNSPPVQDRKTPHR